MPLKLRLPPLLLSALSPLLLLGQLALAAPQPPRQANPVPLIDIVAVVDDSGSMTEGAQPNDPANLRYAAVRLLVDLAQSGDRVDVVSFTDDVRVVGASGCFVQAAADYTTTCPRTTVGESNRADLRARLEYDGRRGNTRMDLALAQARNLLRSSRDGRSQYIFFLTDGKPSPVDQLPALYQVIDDLAADGVQVFPILLGSQTAEDLTGRLVQRTNGIAYPAVSAADLINVYGAIYASIRPRLYVSVLESDPTGYVEFFTNETQGITEVTLVLPRPDETAVYRTLNLDESSLTTCQPLGKGLTLDCLQPPDKHYDRFRLTHNQPISGKWTAQLNGAQKILAIVQSQTDLTLTAPPPLVPGQRPSTHWVAARRGEALVIVNPLQSGKLVADLPLSLNGAPLDGHAYSVDGTAYWQIVPAPPANTRAELKLQVGREVAPIVLQQTVYLQAGDFPLLVVDAPQPNTLSLTEQNQLQLRTHFETTPGLTEPAVRAVVRDVTNAAQPAVVYEGALTCDEAGACADENFNRVEFGHTYEVLFVAQARFNGTLYGDFARATVSTPNQLYIEGLPSAGLDLASVITASLPLKLRAVGVGDFCTPQAQLNLHRSDSPDVSVALARVELTAPALAGGQTVETALRFAGLEQLPPGQYLGEVKFTCGALSVIPPQVPVAYGLTPGSVNLQPNGPLDFGALETAGQTSVVKLDLTLSSPEIIPHLSAALISTLPDATSKVVLTTGPVEQVQDTHYQLPLYLTLREAGLAAAHYEAQIQIAARPGDVLTPPDGVVTALFNRPAAVLQTVRLLPNGPIDFGLLETIGQTVIRPLDVELSDPQIPLTVTLVSVSPDTAPGVTLATGPVIAVDGQHYQLPLFLTLQTDLPLGQYHGQVLVSTEGGALLTPADGAVTIQFKRPTFWESVGARFEPIRVLLDWWLWPFTSPAWPAFICWPALVIAGVVGYRLIQNWTFDRELRQRRGAVKSPAQARHRPERGEAWQAPDGPAPIAPKPRSDAPPPTPRAQPPVAPAPKPADEARRKRYRDE